MKKYTYEEVYNASLEYFRGDKLAAGVFVGKYALKDLEGAYYELSPKDMHYRLAKEFSRIEKKYPNPMSQDEIYDLFKNFKYIVPQGSPMAGIGNDYQIQSISNCFVIESPHDSYAGILHADQQQVQIMKRRGGVGFDISKIRPRGLSCENAARTTDGIELFMDRFSNSCREVAQGGRRGALMLSISVHHPQIMDFIKIKQDLSRVTGANLSVRVTDDFMNSVKNDDLYTVQWPVNIDIKKEKPQISNLKNAREVWDALIEGAHASAEPGVLFWDTAKKMTPSDIYEDDGFGSTSTNPCGEIILSPGDSCRLMLVNLASFVDRPWGPNAEFDWGKYAVTIRKAQRLMDDMIDLEIEQIDKILMKVENDPEPEHVKNIEKELWEFIKAQAIRGRRTGLGITGLGDTIAMLNQTYGSEQSIKTVEEIYKWLALNSYEESIILAKERGAFPICDVKKEQGHPFLERIINNLLPERIDDYYRYGRRNIANTTTAPAGSVSCLTQTTSGIEPAFQAVYKRRKNINPNDEGATVAFVDKLGDKWSEYTVYHHGFQDWLESIYSPDAQENFTPEQLVDLSPYKNSTANEINWRSKVSLQSAAQKWVCHAISNTTNLPADIDVQTVKDIYVLGWELGCKGVTVYRDGSRSGVLVSGDDKSIELTGISSRHAPKRPETLDCDIHHTTIKGERWIVIVGLLEGKPYEVMGGKAELIEVPKKYYTGSLTKRSYKTTANKYDLRIPEGEDELVIKDVVSVFDNPDNAGYTRVISTSLRHGVPVQFLVEQMHKDKESSMFSFSKCVARCLKKYIEDGSKASESLCTNCGSEDTIIYQEGCQTCTACGFGACG